MQLLLFSILSACLALSQTATPEGDALFNKQDWAGAAAEFKKVTDQHPVDGRAWFRLGASLYRSGSLDESGMAFRHAAELQFQTGTALAGVARAYAASDHQAQAMEWLGKAVKAGFSQIGLIDSDPRFTSLKGYPGFAELHAAIIHNGNLCIAGPEYSQLDFWIGDWDVQVSGQTIARSKIEKIADGCIVQENWMPFAGNEGKSWNFYNAATSKWEQHWMSAGSVLSLEGQLSAGVMDYRGVTQNGPGKAAQERLTFTPMDNHRVHQVWIQSTDGGQTWATVFDGIYIPHPKEQPISSADRQELIDHLKRSQQIFADALKGVSTAQAHFKPSPERWSILECAEHLAQAETLLFADAMAGLKAPIGGKSRATNEQILQVWGTAATKVKSSGDYDPIGRWPDLTSVQAAFEERRTRTLMYVAVAQDDLRGRICCGNLDIWQQLFAISAHTLRHVTQMNEVKKDPAYPTS